MRPYRSLAALAAGLAMTLSPAHPSAQAQPPAARPPLTQFDTKRPAKLDIVEAKGRFKVTEQLVGIDFPSDAVGTTEGITGTLVIGPDGSVGSQSKITVDLRTLKSEQEMRDGYIQRATLETGKFPMLEFVPTKFQGMPVPLPSPPQAQAVGFQLIGNMTPPRHRWPRGASSRRCEETVAGRATTTVLFSDLNMTAVGRAAAQGRRQDPA